MSLNGFFFLTIKRVFKKRLLTNTPKSSVLFVSLIRHWITQIIFGVECPCVMYVCTHVCVISMSMLCIATAGVATSCSCSCGFFACTFWYTTLHTNQHHTNQNIATTTTVTKDTESSPWLLVLLVLLVVPPSSVVACVPAHTRFEEFVQAVVSVVPLPQRLRQAPHL